MRVPREEEIPKAKMKTRTPALKCDSSHMYLTSV